MAAAQAESCSTQADSPSPQTTLTKENVRYAGSRSNPVRQPRTEKEDHQKDQQIAQLALARRVMIAAAIAGAFLLSATLALVLNSQGNSGEQVAEAASRVNRQVDDTQDAFTNIKELIPEEHQLEAAPATNYEHRQTSGAMPPQPQMPAAAGEPPVADDGTRPSPAAAPHRMPSTATRQATATA